MLSSIPERAAAVQLPALRAQALIPQLVRGDYKTGDCLVFIKTWGPNTGLRSTMAACWA